MDFKENWSMPERYSTRSVSVKIFRTYNFIEAFKCLFYIITIYKNQNVEIHKEKTDFQNNLVRQLLYSSIRQSQFLNMRKCSRQMTTATPCTRPSGVGLPR
jgi:hypothetical protein